MSGASQGSRHGRLVAITLSGLMLATLARVTPAFADGEPIKVFVDRAKVMHISRPADIVIIGNPAIADATIQDSQTLIITGRSYGTTNLIILDSQGKAIADEILNVGAADEDKVTVYSGSQRVTLSCTPECSPTLAVGDRADAFNQVTSQVQAHNSLSSSASTK